MILGAPYGWSKIAFRPFGPRVTETASASWSTPRSMSARPSVPKWISLPLMALACLASGRAPRLSKGCILRSASGGFGNGWVVMNRNALRVDAGGGASASAASS